MSREAMKQALEVLEQINELSVGENAISLPGEIDGAMDALRAALDAPEQEPVAWRWHQAPVKTQWGHDMVVADLAIDKDHTVSVYCERDQTEKVEAMFRQQLAAQWVGLTEEEIMDLWPSETLIKFVRLIEAKLREKNT